MVVEINMDFRLRYIQVQFSVFVLFAFPLALIELCREIMYLCIWLISTFPLLPCGLVNSYCKKAKSVFRELDQVPYVVELDERGVF